MVMNWKERLGQEIEKARRRHPQHMTQEQLAEAAKLSRNSICHYERGERAPDFEDLRKIAAALATDHFVAADNMRIEFSANGHGHLQPLPQQLNLDFDHDHGVSVRIQATNQGLVIKKISA